MAIPSFFSHMYGLALMRQNVSTSEWFFVDWCTGDSDFAIDTPGPGTWQYAVWLVVGNDTYPNGGITQVQYIGKGQLAVQQLKR